MIKVGTTSLGYNHTRNFVSLPFNNVTFHKVFDFNKAIAYSKFKLLRKIDYQLLNRFNDFGYNRVDLYHFFNTITPVKKPWIVTFEHTIPRHAPEFIKGFRWLGSDYCKKIIAFSKRAYHAQLFLLDKHPEFRSLLKSKMIILHPTQKLLMEDLDRKDFDRKITFIFIGSAFFRKGGWELVQAFEKLKNLSSELKLIIISRLQLDGYRDHHITDTHIQTVKRLISNNPLIQYHSFLPNEEVLEIMKSSHVSILPSWGETYGYSVLESMASGCAVVVPDVPPFPEFVSSDWGWLINICKTYSEGIEQSFFSEENSQMMINGIVSLVKDILNNRESLKIKCNNTLNRIAAAHDPRFAASTLEKIYIEALQS